MEETIFDNNATSKELERIISHYEEGDEEELTEENYLHRYTNPNDRLGHICHLLRNRGDERWRNYFKKINDIEILRMFALRMIRD